MNEVEYKLRQCYHCGNTGLMEILYRRGQECGGAIYDEVGQIESYEIRERFKWTLLSCPVCAKLTLLEDYSDECTNFVINEPSVLYPISSITFEGVPKKVKSAFEAALKVKNIDTEICLLSLRHTLEAICKERGAKGKTLEAMTEDLLNQGILPELMKDACWIIRKLGNGAAHADDQKVYLHEVDQIIRLLETIVEYLYTLPIQMGQLKDKIVEKSRLKVE